MQLATETLREAMAIRRDSGGVEEIAPDVVCIYLSIVNVYLVGTPGARDGEWVLVDAGLWASGDRILREVAEWFGPDSRPGAIVLTHGHFDHVGSLRRLADHWNVPVYAHELELPYLTGRSSYPPPDPTVGGGAMSWMSPLYPRGPISLEDRVRPLPANGTVPGMPGWRWIHTPGHTPGHVALFRDSDRLLIAGDAFVTTRQESMIGALLKPEVMHGPPAYFTPDWEAAGHSVERLASLEPETVATGHGRPMRGSRMRRDLHLLARDFERLAVPRHGRYVGRPALADENGLVSVPPPVIRGRTVLLAALGAGLLAGTLVAAARRRPAQDDYVPTYSSW